MDKTGVVKKAKESGLKLVRFLYCGNDGVIRGKATHVDYLEDCLDSGIGLTVAMQSFTMLDRIVKGGAFGPVGEIRLVGDPSTFMAMPYSPGSGRIIADMVKLDKTPWEACPRFFLKRMIKLAADAGLQIKAGFENEFYLTRREGSEYIPFDRSLCFSSVGMDLAHSVVIDIIEALISQGVGVEKYYPELGPGQQEIPVRFAPALQAADNQVVFRETVRGVANNHGLVASFAPKPFPDHAGNGCHIHFSAWDEASRENLFYDPAGDLGLSKEALFFIGGILKHLRALVALTAPSVNSYRRLKPQLWSSAFSCYGHDNREAAVRIASPYWGREALSTNLEFKPADPSCNPYIALGGLMACGLDGIKNRIEPGRAIDKDPAILSQEERAALGIYRLPLNLGEAIEALERDETIRNAMGSVLAREYILVRRAEWAEFKDKDIHYEVNEHFNKY